jgi:hypothetical protein
MIAKCAAAAAGLMIDGRVCVCVSRRVCVCVCVSRRVLLPHPALSRVHPARLSIGNEYSGLCQAASMLPIT